MAKGILAVLSSLRNPAQSPAGYAAAGYTTVENADCADDEGPGPYRQRGQKKYGRKRRSRYENNLSVRSSHMVSVAYVLFGF